MPVMLDSCVYLDIFTRDKHWYAWSSEVLSSAANKGTIVINPIIYAEISIRFERIEELEQVLPPDVFDYRPISREVAFLAGKIFLKYRARGGAKIFPLPDFFIGAHAAIENLLLITRDAKRFKTYFPCLNILSP
ncbi:MAG: hypothetical protein BWX80_01745 [Candidatus Hydrogenedentes bacterium ADurb.Bin101]|nr:MAG: hypothetical protein BWX80_01745 [Candidatus Hydrogenedentes bacterium ADurb.Bin101]